jgi:predicted nucleic acid-binding protein
MVAALFDTNILIDFLRGISAARDELARYSDKSISIITWMEVMAGVSEGNRQATRAFLSSFNVIHLNEDIAACAVEIRQQHRIKLPDAVIWATAEIEKLLLVTRNTEDFPENFPGVRMPYMLS